MRRIIVMLIMSSSIATVMAQSWLDFNNNVYLGLLDANNTTNVSTLGSVNSNSIGTNVGVNFLLNNNLYFNFEGSYLFNQKPNFSNDWYVLNTKIGYSYQFDKLNLIPYLNLGLGSQGAYYSNASSINYGVGLQTQMILMRNLIGYIDINYQMQNFTSQINQDFNTKIGGGANYNINDAQSYGVMLGVDYVIENGFYFNPFLKYQMYQQNFTSNGSYGYQQLTPTNNQYQLGINFGLVL